MKIVLAFDSFKGCLSAAKACATAASVLRTTGTVDLVRKPMADGGEGTAQALMAGMGGEWIPLSVTGPLPSMRVDAGYAWLSEERVAVIEMAVASGLPLLRPEQYDPLSTTTRGTGELLADAAKRGAKSILLAVGGSATVDCGLGAASALGWRFLDDEGCEVLPAGGTLSDVRRFVRPESSHTVDIQVLCDVTNPLTGPNGAVAVYAPQKGADDAMMARLEAGMRHVATLIREELNIDVDTLPGAGAAGGLAAGAVAFMGGRLVPGVDAVMDVVGLEDAVAGADWVITGEGCFDEQSVQGKVISGVARLAKKYEVRVGVVAGCVRLSEQEWRAADVEGVESLMQPGMTVEESMDNAEELLGNAVRRLSAEYFG